MNEERFSELEQGLSSLKNQLIGFSDSFSSSIKEKSNFQLNFPLDEFSRKLISQTVVYITKRYGTTTSSATLTVDSGSYDIYSLTAQAASLTVEQPSGSPSNGQPLLIRIKDNGTARTISWNSVFRIIGTTLPTTTVASKYTYVGCVYNSDDTKWDVIMVNQEA